MKMPVNSNVIFPVKNDRGVIAGQAQTSATDPLGENFTGQFTCTPSGVLCQGGDLISLGFLWQNGVMTDLNTLISPGSSLVLMSGGDINSGEEIAGTAFDHSTGEVHAFLAIPTGAVANPVESPKLNLPDDVRKLLQQRRGFGRFGAGPIRPQ